ncbi:Transcription initiation factor TFIID subunit 2 [Saxophila tyrrhenica]|uniref:Ubiquinone biosynthesis monooxygenase COQ6, mitochondrial n=1 Tax=Saxophila tyrrhenica TaxID=1690608 RepID=A0AAV9PE85_9PEZI|nr:Transcription initiation factor TFIID subunit 2 [Saxophila tyrrhenica]
MLPLRKRFFQLPAAVRTSLFSTASKVTNPEIYDVVCVGGGPAGLSLASALRSNASTKGLRIALIDSQALSGGGPQSHGEAYSNRCSSLTPASVKFLKQCGAWEKVEKGRAQDYHGMEVWDGVSGSKISFDPLDATSGGGLLDAVGELVPGNSFAASRRKYDVPDASKVATMCENQNLTSALLEHLNSLGGVEIFDKTTVESIQLGSEPHDDQSLDLSQWPIVSLPDSRHLAARLLIGADGANSPVRNFAGIPSDGWDYGQNGVVATLHMDQGFSPEELRTAYQRFLPSGPIALLPLPGNKASLVWSITASLANKLKSLSPQDFAAMVNVAFRLEIADLDYFLKHSETIDIADELSWRLPNTPASSTGLPSSLPAVAAVQEGSIASFPLRMRHASTYTGHRVALIGDAAHTIHPLAGQGLNLGLADAQSLAQRITYGMGHGMDIGSAWCLDDYNSDRWAKNNAVMGVCDKLQKLYSATREPEEALVTGAMPAFLEEAPAEGPIIEELEYSILRQKVDLDVDFAGRSLNGSTEITIQPLVKELKTLRLHCRQCKPTSIQVGGIAAKWEHEDPYKRSRMPEMSDVRQHDMLKARVETSLRPAPAPELSVTLPAKVKIQELQVDAAATAGGSETAPNAETSHTQSAQQSGPSFAPIKVLIEFEVDSFRDGIHWIGHEDGDRRYPYMYSKVEPWAGNSSCIFPCMDDATSRCSWDISIRCAKTLGDAFKRTEPNVPNGHLDEDTNMANGGDAPTAKAEPDDKYLIDLSEDEAAMDLALVCVGEAVDDVVDSEDASKRTVSFSLTQPVTARHVGFAIGPFEHVDLSSTRESEQEERLGQSAMKVHGYCLPGKSKDVQNTCFPMALAMDDMGIRYGSFPFSSYQMLFIDDFIYDTVAVAGLSFCSAHLLFPKEVIKPMYHNTKALVRALANQWMGVNVIAKEATDEWVVAGIAGFMTDVYLRELCGNNEFRWQQKVASDKVYELDVDRPSIRNLGELLHYDQTIRDFINMKSALVLFILDRRLMKASGSTGVQRIINKVFLQAKTGSLVDGEVSTADFQRICERLGHNKLESFFRQWVFGSGCPIFYVTQRFNKKKLVVEMTIVQKQLERITKPAFEPSSFMREIKEHVGEVWAPETNPVFTGPMTIRIHEADGTPYEHIVEIKEATTRLEIPYNTKYKRLKRSRRQKERQVAEGATGEGGDDALLYCLGNIFDSEEEKREWNLVDWTKEDEDKMGQEHYEWIRMDADFEWVGKIHLVMPLYMYISQLQQDRDIVAQYESMRYLLGSNPHHVNLTILVRTLMDAKYFWGIREMAAEGLAICAKDRLVDIGQFHLMKAFREMFCIEGTNMPKSNDFSDRRNFILQCAIPRAMAQLRDGEGKVPMAVRRFFIDLLKFNDNSNNQTDDGDSTYSDNHYIATLMNCLAESLVASHREKQSAYSFDFGEDEPMEDEHNPDADFELVAIAQIERHRRIDEWESSYQNVYSVTALECLQRLTKAGIVNDKTPEVMKYVRSGNADNVRLAAWRCLSEIGVLRKMKATRYMLHCLSKDHSPRFRDRLLVIFGEALGHIALGDPEPEKVVPQAAADGLVLEQETSNEARKLAATRKTTPEGALVALKNSLQGEEVFAESLWHAATSPDLTLDDVAALCDVAALVFEPVQSLTLRLQLPRMWRCTNLGQGKLKFSEYGPYRQKPSTPLDLEQWERMQELGLKYTGPVAPAVQKKQQQQTTDAALKIKIAQAEKDTQTAQDGNNMPPPPSITPSTEKQSFRLSLGGAAKRKPSMDQGGRAGSPKVQKTSRQQSPAGPIAATPKTTKASPARRRSSTPKASTGKGKKSKIIILRLGHSSAEAHAILNAPPRPASAGTKPPGLQPSPSNTPQLPSAFPGVVSPTNGANGANYLGGGIAFSPPSQAMNLGSFRSYGPAPEASEPASVLAASPVDVKQEQPKAESSDDDEDEVPLATLARNQPQQVPEMKQPAMAPPSAPPAPKQKFKLKLGKKPSQASPE